VECGARGAPSSRESTHPRGRPAGSGTAAAPDGKARQRVRLRRTRGQVAPLAKLDAWKQEKGWSIPWYSSFESDFNTDFNVTREQGEASGLSVFFRLADDVFHTYSTYARGVENLVHTYALLDVTPYGRQEDFEDSPAGWPQKPTYA
jgi:predicted dithiol-disulfide oxidoreductase (DUF899 family)